MRIITLLISLFAICAATAQQDGYYRIQNTKTQRYITVIDNRGSVNITTTDADLGALNTIKGFDRVVANPASVIYIDKVGSDNSYNFKSQGVDTYSIIGYYVKLRTSRKVSGAYNAYAQYGSTVMYLSDENYMGNEGFLMTSGEQTKDWYLKPVDASSDNYFGLKADESMLSDGAYYQTFYAAFPFEFASEGMTAYYVDKVANGYAVWKEVTNGIVPAATPVIIRTTSKEAVDNKLSLLTSTSAKVTGNLLKGVYFNNSSNKHRNQKAFDPATMRVLGMSEDGEVAFVVDKTLEYIPANTAYINVPKGSPEVIKLVTAEEFETVAGIGDLVVDNAASLVKGVYSICGVKLSDDHSALQNAPAGIYIVDGKKVVVRNKR